MAKKAEELKIRTEQRVNEYKRQQMYYLELFLIYIVHFNILCDFIYLFIYLFTYMINYT